MGSALECGVKRLAQEGRAAAECAMQAEKLRVAALAFLHAAALLDASATAANYARAAMTFLWAAKAHSANIEVSVARFADAGHVIWQGMERLLQAAVCLFLAALAMTDAEQRTARRATRCVHALMPRQRKTHCDCSQASRRERRAPARS